MYTVHCTLCVYLYFVCAHLITIQLMILRHISASILISSHWPCDHFLMMRKFIETDFPLRCTASHFLQTNTHSHIHSHATPFLCRCLHRFHFTYLYRKSFSIIYSIQHTITRKDCKIHNSWNSLNRSYAAIEFVARLFFSSLFAAFKSPLSYVTSNAIAIY